GTEQDMPTRFWPSSLRYACSHPYKLMYDKLIALVERKDTLYIAYYGISALIFDMKLPKIFGNLIVPAIHDSLY
ncbi:12870_t:CDS:2, partial [Cetraspora pellucida]